MVDKINTIILHTTRGIYSVEDKLSITTLFVFSYKMGSKRFAELLYCNNHAEFIDKLNKEYEDYEVDFSVRLSDKNVSDCFQKTLHKVIEKFDIDGYYKAIYCQDAYALAIEDIINKTTKS